MTLELLIHSIVRQTTILIAQLATSGGTRAPLAQIADQVFLDLVQELERQGVSRRVSADMFGLGLRTYQRKIQRLGESNTDRGRSLWEAVLEHVRSRPIVTRADILLRFPSDDESQVRSVLHDLSENRLIFSSGTGHGTVYRAASEEELGALRRMRAPEGLDELIWALIYQLGPVGLDGILGHSGLERSELEAALSRLVTSGSVERTEEDGVVIYRSSKLVIPLGAPVGWEAGVFDHFKALVNTITARLSEDRTGASLADRIGGSTYSVDVWNGHPFAEEVYGTLARLRSQLGEQRAKVEAYNAVHGLPESYDRVVLYAGQCLIKEGGSGNGEPD
jgi:hypothetical protein